MEIGRMASRGSGLRKHSKRQEPTTSGPASVAPDGELRREMVGGLIYAHGRMNANTGVTLDTTALVLAALDLLFEKGLIDKAEVERRKQTFAEKVTRECLNKGMGVVLQEPEEDKFSFQGGTLIDCENRVHLCRAACCRLTVALSRQDVEEGVLRWNLANPYVIKQDSKGFCCHLDQQASRCTVWSRRPIPCRAFDCRGDKRIWIDFDGMVPNPNVIRDDWPHCETPGVGEKQSADSSS